MHRGDGFAVAMIVTSIPFSLFTMLFPIVSGERRLSRGLHVARYEAVLLT